jgi:TetR/AcrR family transcriptional repressor of nem operon
MTGDVHARSRLTPKGERTRARIIDAAARLIYERGVAGTTLEDVRAAAGVSGSQLYHYFADKEDLVQAVVSRQADVIVANQRRADLATAEGLRAWRDMVIAAARSGDARGGCPLGSLGSQLAETDPEARALVAAGFGRWSAAIAAGLRALRAGPPPAGIDPDDLAVTLLAALQGGLLLAQVQRDTRPLETAIDTILALASASQPAADADQPARSPVSPSGTRVTWLPGRSATARKTASADSSGTGGGLWP